MKSKVQDGDKKINETASSLSEAQKTIQRLTGQIDAKSEQIKLLEK